MPGETYRYLGHTLYCEGVPLADVAARAGTPCYVYSAKSIVDRFRGYDAAFGDRPHKVCYSVKASSNLAILSLLAREGAGFDIVSGGELYRVIRAGGDPATVVFSGVGKTREEIEYALECGIFCFNCESEGELTLLASVAERLGKTARAAIRINPDIDAGTHAHISTGTYANKFGVAADQARDLYRRAASPGGVTMEGVACHIGSLMLDTSRPLAAARMVVEFANELRAEGHGIRHLDFGGGLGVSYQAEEAEPSIPDFIRQLCEIAAPHGYHLEIEPGRSIVARSGVLLARVLYRKSTGGKEFVVLDAAMNDLIRPVLYEAYHEIVPLRRVEALGTIRADVVGPVCESGDFFAKDREMANVLPGDMVAVCTAGAYGFAQSSNYNSRPRAAEVMVEGDAWRVIRRRESWEDLVRGEG